MVAAAVIDALKLWVDEALRLRKNIVHAEVAFFVYLVAGEDGACPWAGQYVNFLQLLRQTNLVSVQRYSAYRDSSKRIVAELRQEDVQWLGVDGVIEAGRFLKKTHRLRFMRQVIEIGKKQNCPLSAYRIKQISQEISPRVRAERTTPDAAALAKENEALKKENEHLRKENEKLKKENEKLKAKLKK
jgi:hypothetical protein